MNKNHYIFLLLLNAKFFSGFTQCNTFNSDCGEICGKQSVCQNDTVVYSFPTCGLYSGFTITNFQIEGEISSEPAGRGRISIIWGAAGEGRIRTWATGIITQIDYAHKLKVVSIGYCYGSGCTGNDIVLPQSEYHTVIYESNANVILQNSFNAVSGDFITIHAANEIQLLPETNLFHGVDFSAEILQCIENAIQDSSSIPSMGEDTIALLNCPIDTLRLFGDTIDGSAISFNWDFGNGQTSLDRNPSVFYSSPGLYTIRLIVLRTSRSDTLFESLLVPDCNTLRNNNKTHNNHMRVSILPNPSLGVFIVSLEKVNQAEILIYSNVGEIVCRSIVSSPNSEIDLSSYPKGIYFVKIISDGNIYTEKVIVQ